MATKPTTGVTKGSSATNAGAVLSVKTPEVPIERVQIGARMEKRMVKVLKATAELLDVSLGELLEAIVLHEFEGEGACAFGPKTLVTIKQHEEAYGMDYDVHANYRFIEKNSA